MYKKLSYFYCYTNLMLDRLQQWKKSKQCLRTPIWKKEKVSCLQRVNKRSSPRLNIINSKVDDRMMRTVFSVLFFYLKKFKCHLPLGKFLAKPPPPPPFTSHVHYNFLFPSNKCFPRSHCACIIDDGITCYIKWVLIMFRSKSFFPFCRCVSIKLISYIIYYCLYYTLVCLPNLFTTSSPRVPAAYCIYSVSTFAFDHVDTNSGGITFNRFSRFKQSAIYIACRQFGVFEKFLAWFLSIFREYIKLLLQSVRPH